MWFQEGRLLYWEAPKQYYWYAKTLNFEAPSVEDDEVRINYLFIHEDGFITSVDDSNGETFRLMPTPDGSPLAAYIQLYFEAGRQQLQHIGAMTTPAIQQIAIPFFSFPDDYSQSYETMPVVPVHAVRDVLFRHVSEDQPWLFGMHDLSPYLKSLMHAIDAPEDDFEAPQIDNDDVDNDDTPQVSFEIEDEEISISLPEFAYGLTANAQERIEAERPNIIQDARALPPETFDWDWRSKPHLLWNHPSSDLGGNSQVSFGSYPICLLLSESVFPPILTGNYDQTIQADIFKIVSEHIQSSNAFEQPIPLDLPPYEEQVLNCFLQTVLIDQGPELAKEAMLSSMTRSGSFQDSLRRRQEIAENLMRRI